MPSNPETNPASTRPDLDDFITALGGFIGKETPTPQVQGQNFLELFCRSVGAVDGHFLVAQKGTGLKSIQVLGLNESFSDFFNAAHATPHAGPSPVDVAFKQGRPSAIVDFSRAKNLPAWFLGLMEKYGLKSMVAVPLMEGDSPTGVFSIYYRDLCLFDGATLDQLMMMGRMMGTARQRNDNSLTESPSNAAPSLVGMGRLIKAVSGKEFSTTSLYGELVQAIEMDHLLDGAMCGGIRSGVDTATFEGVVGFGLPDTGIPKQIIIPMPMLKSTSYVFDTTTPPPPSPKKEPWELLATVLPKSAVQIVGVPIRVKGVELGLLLGWASSRSPLPQTKRQQLEQMVGVAALALK